jgi:hypothetical protein
MGRLELWTEVPAKWGGNCKMFGQTFWAIMTQTLLILDIERTTSACVLLFSVLVGKEWRGASGCAVAKLRNPY